MTYSTIMPHYAAPLRITKRQRLPMKNLSPRPGLPRPEVVKRSASLPAKLEEAPPTKKLFWFRPNKFAFGDKENEAVDAMLLYGSQHRPMDAPMLPMMPLLDDDESATAYLEAAEDPADLLGLDFIEGE